MATLPTLTKPNAMGVTAKNPLNVNPNPIAPLKTGQMNTTTPATIPSKVAWKDTPEGIAFQKEHANTIDNATGQVIQTNGKNVAPKSSPYNPSTIQSSLDRGIAIQALGLASTPKAVAPTDKTLPGTNSNPISGSTKTGSVLGTQNNTPPVNTAPAGSSGTPGTSGYKSPGQIAEEKAAADRANKPQTNEPAPIQKPQDTTYGGLLTQLASRGQKAGPEYTALNQNLLDLKEKQRLLEQDYNRVTGATMSQPIPLQFQTGKLGVITQQYKADAAALAGEMNAVADQLGAANQQQGMQIGALGSALGAAAPVQQGMEITSYDPVTHLPIYGLGAGGTGANAYSAGSNIKTNQSKASEYGQKSTEMANDVNLLKSFGSQAMEGAKQVNPAGFAAGNTLAQILQNQTNPGAVASFQKSINAVRDQINKILSDPQTSSSDKLTVNSMLQSLDTGSLRADQLGQVIDTVSKIGDTLINSYNTLKSKYEAGGTNIVTGDTNSSTNSSSPVTSNAPISWEDLTK